MSASPDTAAPVAEEIPASPDYDQAARNLLKTSSLLITRMKEMQTIVVERMEKVHEYMEELEEKQQELEHENAQLRELITKLQGN